MITITVNGKSEQLEDNTTVAALVAKLGLVTDGTAVAVDDAIVPKSRFDTFTLKDGMKADVFSLVAGG